MEVISSKTTIYTLIRESYDIYNREHTEAFVAALHTSVLKKKVRFPLLEHAGKALYELIPHKDQIGLTDRIIGLHEIGGNVLAGIILQLRLGQHFNEQ